MEHQQEAVCSLLNHNFTMTLSDLERSLQKALYSNYLEKCCIWCCQTNH